MEKITPKVSIIVPVYNVENYLRKCLDSIINQTLKNIEIICINDGSTDNSLSILEEYASKDERIIVINQENAGVSSARNRGLEIATGEYIAFVDSDDWLEPECYELAVSEFQKDPENDLICWGANVINSRNASEKEFLNAQDWYKANESGKQLLQSQFVERLPGSLWNYLFKSSIIKQYNLKFSNYKLGEDLLFVMLYLGNTETIYYIKKELYNYRLTSNSAMQKYGEIHNPLYALSTKIDILCEAISFYEQYNLLGKFNSLLFRRIWNAIVWGLQYLNTPDDKKIATEKLQYITNHLNSDYDWGKELEYVRKKEFYRIKELNIPFLNLGNKIFGLKIYRTDYPSITLWFLGIKISMHYQKLFSVKNAKDRKHKVLTFLGLKLKFNVKSSMPQKCKKFLQKIFYVKNSDKHKIINILGIKFKIKRKQQSKNYNNIDEAKLKQYISNEIFAANVIKDLHSKTFPKFKGCNIGRDIVIVACGPTMKYYNPINNAIHIGVNKAYQRSNIKLDYLFIQDRLSVIKFIEDIIKYPAQIFMGSYLNREDDWISDCVIPEKYRNIEGINYYFSDYHRNLSYPYLEYYGLVDYGSVAFPATQFALYTNPKRIFIVGCDCSAGGYFDGSKNQNIQNHNLSHLVQHWKNFKKYIETYYPEIEIISINPIGLKGIFKDVYTKEFVNENPTLFQNKNFDLLEENTADLILAGGQNDR